MKKEDIRRLGDLRPRDVVQWTSRFVETPTLIALLAISGVVWFFASLAEEVVEGETHAFDERVLLALRNPLDSQQPLGPGWFQELMRDITGLGSVGILTLFKIGRAHV